MGSGCWVIAGGCMGSVFSNMNSRQTSQQLATKKERERRVPDASVFKSQDRAEHLNHPMARLELVVTAAS